MRIIAFNSSPRDNETSKTELILQKFLEGARRAGAQTETLYLRNYTIKHCLGCFSCWVKTPGRCVQKDDMAEELFDRYLAADLVVLATPLYHFNMNARLKLFIERTLPMISPMLADRGARTGHPYRYEHIPKLAVVSVCGFPEQENFRALALNMRLIAGDLLVAEIYRHSSEALTAPPLAPKVQEVLAAVARAGEEVVQQGSVKAETLAAVTQDLAPRVLLLQLANEYWRQQLAQAGAEP
jgi:multimeric flavodoxin WrbA